ncbi:MAG TPA: hypothetical protein VFU05_06935 [Cyclobacteriaceae bacterium]|nr:hypothetical protein [Cyclobacteriaceae bacterium]
MNTAYNETGLYNLSVLKESKRWLKQHFIEANQFHKIKETYPSPFYHPNFLIRVLLFVAALLALSGVTGILSLLALGIDEGEVFLSFMCLLYGVGSFFFLEKVFIENNHHYKSGVNEALIYHSCGFTIGGIMGIFDFNVHFGLFACFIVLSFAAIRYLDLVCTICAILSFVGIIFYEFNNAGGIFQQIIPFVLIICFTPIYFFVKKIKPISDLKFWSNNLLIVEALSLLFIYAAGNYLVVRELSIEMMDLYLEEGTDIPFAFIFYTLTILIPIAYLYFGVKNKDMVLIRVSLIVIAFSVFTFKYYYSFGHPEITFTVAGLILLAISILLLSYLKTPRQGFTRENLLTEKWANMNAEAFIISQTMGGNQVTVKEEFKGGGGGFGGGGATGGY